MDADYIETDQIFYIGNAPAPGETPDQFIDGLLALGWAPYLVAGPEGDVKFALGIPGTPPPATLALGRSAFEWWMGTKDRRLLVEMAMRQRGLVYYR